MWGCAAALALATLVAFANGLRAPFVFDDIPSIPNNPTLRALWPLSGPLSPPGGGETVTARPILNLSFALNRALLGESPAAFRAVNIALHVASGWLLFGLARRLLQRTRLAADALPLAATAAAIWLLHPLQTAAVTYLVQRAESLMAFFYLLTLYAFVRAVESPRSAAWWVVSWLACLLGMGTKEVMVSAPVIVLACDAIFMAGNARAIPRRRWWFHAALAATWLLLAALVWSAGANRGGSSGAAAFSPGEYWLTQTDALLRYAQRVLWPFPLVFDYGIEPLRPMLGYAAGIAAFLLALGATWLAWRRRSGAAFLGLVLFAVLAPTSVVPGARQFMAEHRMYLALAPLAVGAAAVLHLLLGRQGRIAVLAAVAGLAALTARRNVDYRSGLALWSDTVAKQPTNGWARVNLASALAEAGAFRDAETQLRIVLGQNPGYAMAHFNLGNVLLELDRAADAMTHYAKALELNPGYTAARNNLANALYRAGRPADAATHYAELVARGSDTAAIRYNWGNALFRAGRLDEAIAQLGEALRRQPDYPEAEFNLGAIELERGRFAAAAERFERVLRARPDDADAHTSLAVALAQQGGQLESALAHARDAVRLNPRSAAVHANLGTILAFAGRRDEAIAELTETLRLAPDHTAAWGLLQQLRRQP